VVLVVVDAKHRRVRQVPFLLLFIIIVHEARIGNVTDSRVALIVVLIVVLIIFVVISCCRRLISRFACRCHKK